MSTADIEFDGRFRDQRITKRLQHMIRNGQDLKPALEEIGSVILSSIDENFLQEGRYSEAGSPHGGSNRWENLAQSTQDAREKKGKWPGKILQMSQGGLASSIQKVVTDTSLGIGTNKKYGRIQNKGGQAGRNKSVTIPARPYLVVQEKDIEKAVDILTEHIVD